LAIKKIRTAQIIELNGSNHTGAIYHDQSKNADK
jgi:hypothetical protein